MEETRFYMAAYYLAKITGDELQEKVFDWCDMEGEDRDGWLTMGIQIFEGGGYGLQVEFMYDPSRAATEIVESARVTLGRVLRKHVQLQGEVELVGMQSCVGGPAAEEKVETRH